MKKTNGYIDAANPDSEMRPSPFYNFRHGLQSMTVLTNRKRGEAVLAQDGLRLRKGLTYNFSGWIGTGETSVEETTKPVKIKVGLYPEKRFGTPIDEKRILRASGISRNIGLSSKSEISRLGQSWNIGGPDRRVVADASPSSLRTTSGVGEKRFRRLEAPQPAIIRFPGGCFASYYNGGMASARGTIDGRPRFLFGVDWIITTSASLNSWIFAAKSAPSRFYCLNLLTGSAQEAADPR